MQSEEPPCSIVPTVDLGALGLHHKEQPNQQESARVRQELERAFTDLGCVYLTGHGIPEDLMNDMLSSGINFFRMEKDKTQWKLRDDQYLGYIAPDSETLFGDRRELHESFQFKPGMFDSSTDKAPSFMASVTPYFQLSKTLSRRLMTLFSRSLNKAEGYFADMHKDSGTMKGTTAYRFNYYPLGTGGRENVTGFGAHFDFTFVTFLIGNDSNGFQICDSAGEWTDVPCIPGTILLLCGEFLHYYSNKRFKPMMHRVVLPEEYNSGRQPRCTLMYFEQPDEHVPMWPLSDDPNSPAPPSFKEYFDKKVYRD